MKHHLALLTIATIALTGLSSCSISPPTKSSTEGSTDAAATAQRDGTPVGLVKIGGASCSFSLLKILVDQYASTAKNTKIQSLEPGQSEAIITGLKQKLIDVGSISNILKPEDKHSILDTHNDGTLDAREVAKDGLVVVAHSSVKGVKNLTTDQLKAIYSGKLTNWKDLGGPDAQIILLDRPEDESAKHLLRKHYLGDDLKSAPTAVVLRKEGELIQALQNTPNSIGAFSLAYAVSHNLPVNRLSLNGVEPTAENIKVGKYSMIRSIVIVWNKQSSPATQKLIKSIFSAPSSATLEKSGFVPVSSQT